jgi:hypothetical protein
MVAGYQYRAHVIVMLILLYFRVRHPDRLIKQKLGTIKYGFDNSVLKLSLHAVFSIAVVKTGIQFFRKNSTSPT